MLQLICIVYSSFSLTSAGVYEVGGAKTMGESKLFFLLVNFHFHKRILNHKIKKDME